MLLLQIYREDFPLQSLQSRCITKCCHRVYGLARGHLILKTFFEFEFLQKGNSKRILKTSTEFTLISLCAHVFNAFYTFFEFGKLISGSALGAHGGGPAAARRRQNAENENIERMTYASYASSAGQSISIGPQKQILICS